MSVSTAIFCVKRVSLVYEFQIDEGVTAGRGRLCSPRLKVDSAIVRHERERILSNARVYKSHRLFVICLLLLDWKTSVKIGL